MKGVLVSVVLVLGLSVSLLWVLNQKREILEGELKNVETRSEKSPRRKISRHSREMLVQKMNRTVNELGDYPDFDTIIEQYRDWEADDLKTLTSHLMSASAFPSEEKSYDAKDGGLALKAAVWIMVEVDPNWLVEEIQGYRDQERFWSGGGREWWLTAFASLMEKEPEMGFKHYRSVIPHGEQRYEKPWSKAAELVLAYLIGNSPDLAFEFVAERRKWGFPYSSKIRISSMKLIEQYTRRLSGDVSRGWIDGLLPLLTREAYRLGGFEEALKFYDAVTPEELGRFRGERLFEFGRVVERYLLNQKEASRLPEYLKKENIRTKVHFIKSVVRLWSYRDLSGVTDWVGSLKPGPLRNAALVDLSEQLEYSDPEAAAFWKAKITLDDDYSRATWGEREGLER